MFFDVAKSYSQRDVTVYIRDAFGNLVLDRRIEFADTMVLSDETSSILYDLILKTSYLWNTAYCIDDITAYRITDDPNNVIRIGAQNKQLPDGNDVTYGVIVFPFWVSFNLSEE